MVFCLRYRIGLYALRVADVAVAFRHCHRWSERRDRQLARTCAQFCVCARHGINLYFARFGGRTDWLAVPNCPAKSLCSDWAFHRLCIAGVVHVWRIHITAAFVFANETDAI